MTSKKINDITADLKKKYPELGLKALEIDKDKGTSVFYLEPKAKTLAFLEKGGVIPKTRSASASVITRTTLDRTFLDLAKKDPMSMAASDVFKAAITYYYTDPLVGSTINLLSNLACKGFENDIDDDDIRYFFDMWAFDVKFLEILEWIFLDFFKTGHVTTYKVLANYQPRVSYISPIPGKKIKKVDKVSSDLAAKKKIWSKNSLPAAYTVLNPLLVNIEGNLLFDKVNVSLKPPDELKKLISKKPGDLTIEEKDLIKLLPADFRAAIKEGKDYILDSRLVGFITYKKMPYERYAKPRIFRIFDSLEYKKSLKDADISTLDGITNYILKITIGNDEYPVTSQTELSAVAELFNTPGKSFDVIWNHTLKVEKIVSPEIGTILGQEKYKQVNEDLTGGLAISRALIDGASDLSVATAQLLIKGLQEEISYARNQVTRWIYNEYRQIAEAMKFDRFPKIRWDDSVLRDTIMYMGILSQLVDRRMLSYRTALEELGFDYSTELSTMEKEFPLVKSGIFGIIGSPWQKAKTQPTQGGPIGAPSDGRPKGKPAKTKQPQTPTKKNQTKLKKTTNPQKTTDQKVASLESDDIELDNTENDE